MQIDSTRHIKFVRIKIDKHRIIKTSAIRW